MCSADLEAGRDGDADTGMGVVKGDFGGVHTRERGRVLGIP